MYITDSKESTADESDIEIVFNVLQNILLFCSPPDLFCFLLTYLLNNGSLVIINFYRLLFSK